MSPEQKYSEWRILTPILLAGMSILLTVVGYLIVDKLNSMNDKSDRLFAIVGGVKTSFENYQITAENRFTRLETEMTDVDSHLSRGGK